MDSLVAAGQIWVHQQTWVHLQRLQMHQTSRPGSTFRSGFNHRFWLSWNNHNQNCRPCWFTARGLHCYHGSDCMHCHGPHSRADVKHLGAGGRQRAAKNRAIVLGLMRRMSRRWLRHHDQCWHIFQCDHLNAGSLDCWHT